MVRRIAWMGVALSMVVLGTGCSTSVDAEGNEEDLGAASSQLSRGGDEALLGALLFFDTDLSDPPGQACATCHDPRRAFTPADTSTPTAPGAVRDRFGPRNSPTAAYASFVPRLTYDAEDDGYEGGLFLDGRVDTLEAQAEKPFLNPLEMNDANESVVVAKVRRARYAPLFRRVFGRHVFEDANGAFHDVAKAIASFERTRVFSPFSSKFDAYRRGETRLSVEEARGLSLFEDPKKGNCAACHPVAQGEDGAPPLFTDFTYDNLGLPKNPRNRFLSMPPNFNPDGANYVDRGLGVTVGDPKFDGKFRVPTLRNIAITAPYMHNGVFADLRTVVAFYNTRDVAAWDAPEVPATMNREELGNLRLTEQEVDDIVSFLGTLTDGYYGPRQYVRR